MLRLILYFLCVYISSPVCGNISNKGTLVAYGLAEAGIRICPVENARDVTDAEVWDSRPSDPESFYGIKSIGGHDGTVYGVHFHPRTKLLFSVGQDSFMRAWDLNAENPRCRVVYRYMLCIKLAMVELDVN